jgi:hypothetical protein
MPPPGAGLETVTRAVPAAARSPGSGAKSNLVLLFTMVARFTPFHCPTVPATNPVPVTVTASPETFAEKLAGNSEAIVGTGLGTAGKTVNVAAVEVPPTAGGFPTVTCAVDAVAMSALEMAAVNCVLLTNFVGRSLPFQRMIDPATNFEPSTVNVSGAPPAVLLDGLSEATTGVIATILNETALEMPPPGGGADTVT